jgi:hypothetical protein
MSDLQKFIREHQDEMNDAEPTAGHFERFAARLEEQSVGIHPPGRTRSQVLKVAALIVMLITVSVFVFDFATREIRERFANGNKGTELPVEIREAVQYYDSQAATQLATINKLAANNTSTGAPGVSALQEIRSLDATTEELMRSLDGNPGNEHILDAIIRNQRMKETMLNTIIIQLSQYKK